MILSDKIVECLRSILPREDLITHTRNLREHARSENRKRKLPLRLKQKKPTAGGDSRATDLVACRGHFVRVVGEPVSRAAEYDRNPDQIDHIHIMIRAGGYGILRIAINTSSLPNRVLGFNPNVQIAVIPSKWMEPPATGVFLAEPLDYADLEKAHDVDFREYERTALEELLLRKIDSARFIEGWGDLYVRGHAGIHQVHSRRASTAFPMDHIGRDGALRFYFPAGETEMLLFKFFGQP